LEVVLDDEVGQRRVVRALAFRVVRRLRPRVRLILENGFEEASGQRQPFAPRRRRQTVEFLADPADDVFERQRPVAV
jgi:hypothetical protein